ncbi:MAG: hypothetical protein WC781_00060 [Candidatus Pacearchaeota archaeon]|jgi:hypothetical protein
MGLNKKPNSSREKQLEKCEYKGIELIGYRDSEHHRYYPPKRMLEIYKHYETLLKCRDYKTAEFLEDKNHYPVTWMNYVISGIITGSENGKAEELVNRFRYRGYSDNWLKKGKEDNGKVNKSEKRE